MQLAIRCGYPNRGMPINEIIPVNQAMVAVGTADFHGENARVILSLDGIEAAFGHIEDFRDASSLYRGEISAVDDHHRSQGTGAETIDSFESEFLGGGGFSRLDSKLLFDLFGNGWGISYMA